MSKKSEDAAVKALEPTPSLPLADEMLKGVRVATKAGRKTNAIELDGTIKDAFKYCGSSQSPSFNVTLFGEVLGSLWVPSAKVDDEAAGRMVQAAAAALKAFKAADEIEGMIAAQAVTCHFVALECLRRANIAEQPFEIAARLRKDAANMMRTMTEMLEALDRKRGKGPQVVRVERVIVHEGGQAVVGNVTPGG